MYVAVIEVGQHKLSCRSVGLCFLALFAFFSPGLVGGAYNLFNHWGRLLRTLLYKSYGVWPSAQSLVET